MLCYRNDGTSPKTAEKTSAKGIPEIILSYCQKETQKPRPTGPIHKPS